MNIAFGIFSFLLLGTGIKEWIVFHYFFLSFTITQGSIFYIQTWGEKNDNVLMQNKRGKVKRKQRNEKKKRGVRK